MSQELKDHLNQATKTAEAFEKYAEKTGANIYLLENTQPLGENPEKEITERALDQCAKSNFEKGVELWKKLFPSNKRAQVQAVVELQLQILSEVILPLKLQPKPETLTKMAEIGGLTAMTIGLDDLLPPLPGDDGKLGPMDAVRIATDINMWLHNPVVATTEFFLSEVQTHSVTTSSDMRRMTKTALLIDRIDAAAKQLGEHAKIWGGWLKATCEKVAGKDWADMAEVAVKEGIDFLTGKDLEDRTRRVLVVATAGAILTPEPISSVCAGVFVGIVANTIFQTAKAWRERAKAIPKVEFTPSPEDRDDLRIAFGEKSSPEAISLALARLRKSPTGIEATMQEGLKLLNASPTLRNAGMGVAKIIAENTPRDEPDYHNYGHDVDVMVSYVRLAKSEPSSHFSNNPNKANHLKALGLLAAVSHDFNHPGGNNAPGKPEELERQTTEGLHRLFPYQLVSGWDREVIEKSIHQTDHMLHLEANKTNYTKAIGAVKEKEKAPISVIAALLRQADLYRSTALTVKDCIESGKRVKAEFTKAGKTNCPHLDGLAFIQDMGTPKAALGFNKMSPVIIQSDEGNRLRKQMMEIEKGLLAKKEAELAPSL